MHALSIPITCMKTNMNDGDRACTRIAGADIKDVRLLVGDLPVFIDGLLLEEGVPGIVLGLDILAKLPSLVLSTKSRKMLVPIPGATKPAVAVEDGAESGK